jgi:uncharacterized protein
MEVALYLDGFLSLPESVRKFVSLIAESGQASKIILFGSRARGDFRENSDFDLAVQWVAPKSEKVLQLLARLDEAPITLYKTDVLELNSASRTYLDQIEKEGQLLWVSKA